MKQKTKKLFVGLGIAAAGFGAVLWWRQRQYVEGPERASGGLLESLGIGSGMVSGGSENGREASVARGNRQKPN